MLDDASITNGRDPRQAGTARRETGLYEFDGGQSRLFGIPAFPAPSIPDALLTFAVITIAK